MGTEAGAPPIYSVLEPATSMTLNVCTFGLEGHRPRCPCRNPRHQLHRNVCTFDLHGHRGRCPSNSFRVGPATSITSKRLCVRPAWAPRPVPLQCIPCRPRDINYIETFVRATCMGTEAGAPPMYSVSAPRHQLHRNVCACDLHGHRGRCPSNVFRVGPATSITSKRLCVRPAWAPRPVPLQFISRLAPRHR
jgi:hypothetical protein